MNSNELRLQQLQAHLDKLISMHEVSVNNNFRAMESFNTPVEDFCQAITALNKASFALSYLRRAKYLSETAGFKTAENFVRYHKYQLEGKSVLEDIHSVALCCLISIIETILDNNPA